MMFPLFAGIAVGLFVAIPPGPMSMVILKQTLTHGARRGVMISTGTSTLDFVYCSVFMFAAGTFFTQISAWLEAHTLIVAAFQAVCIVGLVIYGVHNLRTRRSDVEASLQAQPDAPAVVPMLPKFFTTHGPFLLGVGMSLTQLANPTFVPLMTYISLLAHERGFVQQTSSAAASGGGEYSIEYLAFAFGYALGVFGWLYAMIRLSIRYRASLSVGFLLGLNRFVGITLVAFGVYLAYRLSTSMNWQTTISTMLSLS